MASYTITVSEAFTAVELIELARVMDDDGPVCEATLKALHYVIDCLEASDWNAAVKETRAFIHILREKASKIEAWNEERATHAA